MNFDNVQELITWYEHCRVHVYIFCDSLNEINKSSPFIEKSVLQTSKSGESQKY